MVFKDFQLNCFEMLIADILLKNKLDYHYAFHEVGLCYFESTNKKDKDVLFTDNSKYSEILERIFNIKMIENIYNDFTEYSKNITNKLESSSVIVKLDNFYLPYSNAYKKKHMVHAISIIYETNRYYYISDNYYGYEGKVEKKIIFEAIQKLLKIKGHYGELISFDFLNCETQNIDTSAIKRKNLSLMIDKNYYPQLKGFNKYVGIFAIDRLKKNLEMSIQTKNIENIEDIAEITDRISRSRIQGSVFFKLFNDRVISKVYGDAQREWAIITVLLMKVFVREDFSSNLSSKLFSRLENIKKKEIEIVKHLKAEINTY
ncbi:hypothetical protein ABID30_000746 [Enterococcus rotai]|uniref:Butirosin biosynthesis protein H N-terminal domain-containing protein n=1 Tax=Enterococcus rotai TaxID=118060 RepID=A0A0U2VRQ3_9ENTE|nr:BtrH N-terminal domain-containing protein [Enterococcus rotai]ALS36068.1 hypothetical protein ATZ35_02495 [Enterococcus rotai]